MNWLKINNMQHIKIKRTFSFIKRSLIALLLFLLFHPMANAFVKIPDVLSNGMILQQHVKVPIWGTALPGEAIEVSFNHQQKNTLADINGNWKIYLDPMDANATPQMLVIRGINEIHIKDVQVGEVWLCTGQSNMQLILSMTSKGDSVIASANYPMLHLFNVSRENSFGHARGPLGEWLPCTPASIKEFSAAAYYFGLALQQKLKVPVGIINASFGGSQAEAWTPKTYLEIPELEPCIARDTAWSKQRATVQVSYRKQLEDWAVYAKKERAAGRKPKEAPHQPEALRDYRPTTSIYNAMIAPLIPYAIKGNFWYQGENNEDRAEQYGTLLPVMIRSWRDNWNEGNFPFGIVQLPNYRDHKKEPEDGAWSHLRDAQRWAADTVKNAGLIVTIDIGEAHNIHYHDKYDLGRRMFQWALSHVYKFPVLPSGPMFEKAEINKATIIASFNVAGNGLRTKDGKAPQCFAIAGENHQWHWAKAKIINKNQIVVWSEDVKKPIAIRYAFNNNPIDPNITNDSGLPAAPFRTDNWPGPTHGKR
ncbi:sialate O-acetylesterase [Arachidicoccus soli]|uniref:Sialate O-acetylesterase n=2 Tax=Arachidicoccus soli TaxID=2341117 RepID=A0A386HR17_9BACT|nr:sialate O-acetylesterase [Arachidicoccus soli]